MTKHSKPRLIGWLSPESMNSAEAANAAIQMAAEVEKACLIQMDRASGKMVLTSRDADDLPNHFIRGVSHASDPDVLAYDLLSEAMECKLMTARGLTKAWEPSKVRRLKSMAGKATIAEISAACERSVDAVKHKAREMGISLSLDGEYERLGKAREIAMYHASLGATIKAAAQMAGVSTSTVHRWLRAQA